MTTYAIIGDGGAGTTAAYYIRRADPDARITIYSDDPNPAYYRAALTNFLMGELRADQLFAVPPNFYSDWKVERVLTRVNKIDTGRQTLELSDGQKPAYDQLFVGCGSRARTLPLPGSDLDGVYPMRTMQDARRCLDHIASGRLKHAVIQGGGILGIEWVAALRTRKVEATFLIREPAFWVGIIDKACSDLVLSRCRHYGVDVRTEEEITEATGRDGTLTGVKLKRSGESIDAQLWGVAVGIVPNTEFLEGSGIKTDRAIVVDDFMRTNIPNVYAGGDCAQVTDPATQKSLIMGLWEPARHHGRVAGTNMAGGSATWNVQTQYNATRLYDLDLAAIGQVVENAGDETVLDFPTEGGRIRYQKLIIRENRLVGALLLGQRKEKPRARGRMLHKIALQGLDISDVRDQLLDPMFDIHNWIESVSQTGGLAHGVTGGGAPMYSTPGTVSAAIGQFAPNLADASAATVARTALSSLMTKTADPVGTTTQILTAPTLAPRPKTGPAGLPAEPLETFPTAADEMVYGRIESQGRVYEIRKQETDVGQDPRSEIPLADHSASYHHAQISRFGKDLYLRDMGSPKGTYINAGFLNAPHLLVDGDVIGIGTTQLVFRGTPRVVAPEPRPAPEAPPKRPADVEPAASADPTYFRPIHTEEILPAPAKGFARLTGVEGPMKGISLHIAGESVIIGSAPDSDISIEDESVRPHHARIEWGPAGWVLTDLEGGETSALAHGSRIKLGPYVFTFEVQQ